jgi:cytidine deaminase
MCGQTKTAILSNYNRSEEVVMPKPKRDLRHALWLSQVAAFEEQISDLLHLARTTARNAQSYRDFRVGCAVYAYSLTQGTCAVFLGANQKPEPGPTWKMCAEKEAATKAINKGFNRIIGMAIAGDVQADEETGIESEILPPCGECRRSLLSLSGVYHDSRLVLAHLSDDGVMQMTTVGELLVQFGDLAIPRTLAS